MKKIILPLLAGFFYGSGGLVFKAFFNQLTSLPLTIILLGITALLGLYFFFKAMIKQDLYLVNSIISASMVLTGVIGGIILFQETFTLINAAGVGLSVVGLFLLKT